MMMIRFMRMILFFDLPAVSKTDHREYRKFIKMIKSLGFVAYQESVYTKLALNDTVVISTMKEIKQKLPKDGVLSVLSITEKQFSSIENILGNITTDVIMSEDKIIKL